MSEREGVSALFPYSNFDTFEIRWTESRKEEGRRGEASHVKSAPRNNYSSSE